MSKYNFFEVRHNLFVGLCYLSWMVANVFSSISYFRLYGKEEKLYFYTKTQKKKNLCSIIYIQCINIDLM